MRKYVINGKFMADNMMGIVRYAREMTKALDNILEQNFDVTLLLPPNAKDIPAFNKIRVEFFGQHTGIKWEQIDLRKYIKQHQDRICINFCNVTPLFIKPGITVIHDIMYKVNPSHYTTLRNRLSRYWHIFQYWYVMRHEKMILTVSRYSKNDIERYFPKACGKVKVVPNAWQHVLSYQESTDWQERYPFLKEDEYYFSLATLSKSKNGKWIIELAKHNPERVYAIAGAYYETEKLEIPKNVYMLGFISDEDICALIRHCRAFIYPSLYEGFGLPPLEALALGAEVISSNAASLPEVLGKSVHYISPMDANVNIELLLKNSVENRELVLAKYSWEKSAKMLLEYMCMITDS